VSALHDNYPELYDLTFGGTSLTEELQRIAALLEAHPKAGAAARDTRRILDALALGEGLENVWANAAGVEARDYDPDDFTEALETYSARESSSNRPGQSSAGS
jgi:hypothetical protein